MLVYFQHTNFLQIFCKFVIKSKVIFKINYGTDNFLSRRSQGMKGLRTPGSLAYLNIEYIRLALQCLLYKGVVPAFSTDN